MRAGQRGSEPAAGVSHLLVAADVLSVGCSQGTHVAVCGEVVETATAADDPRYCPECVRAAVRWTVLTEAGRSRDQLGRRGRVR